MERVRVTIRDGSSRWVPRVGTSGTKRSDSKVHVPSWSRFLRAGLNVGGQQQFNCPFPVLCWLSYLLRCKFPVSIPTLAQACTFNTTTLTASVVEFPRVRAYAGGYNELAGPELRPATPHSENPQVSISKP